MIPGVTTGPDLLGHVQILWVKMSVQTVWVCIASGKCRGLRLVEANKISLISHEFDKIISQFTRLDGC